MQFSNLRKWSALKTLVVWDNKNLLSQTTFGSDKKCLVQTIKLCVLIQQKIFPNCFLSIIRSDFFSLDIKGDINVLTFGTFQD